MTSRRLRTGIVVMTAACLTTATVPAWAGVHGKVARDAMVTSASWGAVGATTGGSPTIGVSFTLTWVVNLLGVTPQYFKVVNTGTLDLTAETYTTTISAGPKITLTACTGGTWNTLTGKCSGSTVSLGDSGSGPTPASVDIPVGSSVPVQAKAGGLVSLLTTTSIKVSVSRSQARLAQTTNS